MVPDKEMGEASSLAGLLQRIVEDCKSTFPLLSTLQTKSSSLQSQLNSTISVLSSFLETLQNIADAASKTKGSSTDLGLCLSSIVLQHRAVESHLKTMASSLFHCLHLPLQSRKEEWRKKVVQMGKEHSKQFKKMRKVIIKKSEALVKADKQLKKNKNTPELVEMRNNLACDLQEERNRLCLQERMSLREISAQERSIFTRIAAGVKPVIVCEVAMFREVEQLGEVMEKLNKIIIDNNYDRDSNLFMNSSKESYIFATPPSTPGGSKMGSRSNSVRSINSFSRSSSVARNISEDAESYRSRNNSISSHQSFRQQRNSNISNRSQVSECGVHDNFSKRNEPMQQFCQKTQQNTTITSLPNNFPQKRPMTISDSSFPLGPSSNLVHALPPLPPATVHKSKLLYRTPLPHKLCPTVPVRRSSLERPDTDSMQNMKTQKAGNHTLARSEPHDNGNEDHSHEEAKTPTNERGFLIEIKPESTISSGSSHSSGYGSVATVANQGMKDPDSPEMSRTLKRTPRRVTFTSPASSTPSTTTPQPPPDQSTADRIRNMTDRLSILQ